MILLLLHDNNTNIIIIINSHTCSLLSQTLGQLYHVYFTSLNLMMVGTIVNLCFEMRKLELPHKAIPYSAQGSTAGLSPISFLISISKKKESVFGELVCIVKSSSLYALESRGGDRPGP